MRPIHLVHIDTWRPAVVLTREQSRDRMRQVTVAPITSRMHGLAVEVPVGPANGLDHPCAISADGITTVGRELVGKQIGWLLDDQEPALAAAISYALDLDISPDK